MMRKKICLALSVLFACWLGFAGAQSVVVDGVGADEAAAQRDAVRNAVEQAAGTYLSSRMARRSSMRSTRSRRAM